MGEKFIDSRSPPFEKSFEETTSITPVFFILSPGVDPLKVIFFFFFHLNWKHVYYIFLFFQYLFDTLYIVCIYLFIYLFAYFYLFKDVEKLGKSIGFTFDKRNFHNVSLGQGQEPVAEESMDIAAKNGHWVILQNIHLVKSWLSNLEKKMEQLSDNPHQDYRLFISAEPSPDPHESIIPQVFKYQINNQFNLSILNTNSS